jgi:hypothetical protein
LETILPYYYQSAEAMWGELSLERAKGLLDDLNAISANAERMAKSHDSQSHSSFMKNVLFLLTCCFRFRAFNESVLQRAGSVLLIPNHVSRGLTGCFARLPG